MSSILVADDALIVRRLVVTMLTNAGYEVVGEAGTGPESVELYELLHPDLVILDVNMPGGDGIAAAATIRDLDPDANVMLASVLVDEQRHARALAAGVSEFVTKPFAQAELLAAVDRALAA